MIIPVAVEWKKLGYADGLNLKFNFFGDVFPQSNWIAV